MQALRPDDPHQVGKYRLLHRLGAGGMGQVYLGISPGRRLVAVKVIHGEFERHPEYLARFRREVLANRLVTGAFTAPVFDHDSYASPPWLVTSYVPGPSLKGAVRDAGPLPEGTVVLLAGALAEALASIHEAGLVHRDLKPSNVLLAEDGPRVIDFGIARVEDITGITRTKQPLGTYGYIAPEFLSRGESTTASDMFALGGVLVYAATGSSPFGSGSDHVLAYRTVHEQPRLEGITNPELLSLITDCTDRDPAARPTPQQVLERTGFNEHRSTLLDASAWAPAAERTVALREEALDLAEISTLPEPDRDREVTSGPGRGGRLTRRSALFAGGAALVAGAGGLALWRSADGHNGTASADQPAPKSSASATPRWIGPKPVACWPMNDGSGRKVKDTAGHHDAKASGIKWASGRATFDGLHGYAETTNPVVAAGPDKAFTVVARVRVLRVPEGPKLNQRRSMNPGTESVYTAVAQQVPAWEEAGGCSFYLQYLGGGTERWAFSLSGAVDGTPGRAHSNFTVADPSGWTHLTGVQDKDGTLQLYVDGKPQERVKPEVPPIPRNGPLLIGRAVYDDKPSDWFSGDISEVRLYDRALTGDQVYDLVAGAQRG